jgi:hypothetical protein
VRSRKAKEKIHQGKAQLNSVSMQLQQQVGKFCFERNTSNFIFAPAQMKIAGCMQKSTSVMKSMNQ